MADAERASLAPPIAWAVTLAATATMAVSYLDRQVLAALAPTVTAELDLNEEQYGWTQSAFSFAYLAATPFAGRWLARAGVRRGMVGAVLVWTLVSSAHALMGGFPSLFALRLALGVAESPSFPGSAATVAAVLPPSQRTRGVGILYTGSSFGAMVAPFLATQLAHALHWRAAFLGVALAGLLWVPMWIALTARSDVRGALDAARQAEPSARVPWREVLGDRVVWRACLLVLSASPPIAFGLLWGAKLLVAREHVLQEDVGRYLWLGPLLFDLGAVLFGDLATRRARRRNDGSPAIVLLAISTAITCIFAVLPFVHGPWPTIVVAAIAMGGGGGMFAILTGDMVARLPASRVAQATGITAATQSVAYIVANPLIGRAVETFHGYEEIAVALALAAIPGAIAWCVIPASKRAG